MSTQSVAGLSSHNVSARRNGSGEESSAQPVLIRLDTVPATVENRLRILERVRRLNRSLEELGTPFRLRLL
jgi:hypothetical protein